MIIHKIYGGPGAGKTTRLLQIIMSELDSGVNPNRLLFTTHTNAGVNEGVHRALKAGGGAFNRNDLMYFATIHALCARFAIKGKVMPIEARAGLISALMEDGVSKADINRSLRTNAYSAAVGTRADERLAAQFATTMQATEYVANAVKAVAEHTGMVLLENLVSEAEAEPLPIDVAIVDEAQDLTPIQWKIVLTLCKNVQRLYVAGDLNQAIFEWAGADYTVFRDLSCADEEALATTYRCCKQVWGLVSLVHSKYPKDASSPIPINVASSKEGFVTILDKVDEQAELQICNLCVSGQSVFLLATTSRKLDLYRELMTKAGIAYTDRCRGKSMGYEWLMDFHAIWECCVTRSEEWQSNALADPTGAPMKLAERARQLMPTMSTDWKTTCIEHLWELLLHAEELEKSLVRRRRWALYVLNTAVRKQQKSFVTVSTVHRVKGGEADYVVYDMHEHANGNYKRRCSAINQLRHLFVAVSRAKLGVMVYNSSGITASEGGVTIDDLRAVQTSSPNLNGIAPIQLNEFAQSVYNELFTKITTTWFVEGAQYEVDNDEQH